MSVYNYLFNELAILIHKRLLQQGEVIGYLG